MRHHGIRGSAGGFVLVAVLVVMQLLLLAGWMTIEKIHHAVHSLNVLLLSEEAFSEAEALLETAERRVMSGDLHCLVERTSLSGLVGRWLRPGSPLPGCQGVAGSASYGYCVEFLGADPCLQLEASGEPVGYFRISLLLEMPQQAGHVILQTILFKAGHAGQHCPDAVKDMPKGRIAWREAEMDIV